jgi:DNA-binding beta-propeller fold protein YncE
VRTRMSVNVLVAVVAMVLVPVAARATGNVYVANAGSFTVSQYAIGSGGLLSALSPATATAGDNPRAIAVTPDGKSAYVTNFFGNSVSQYDVDSESGALSPKTPATVAARLRPGSIAVTPDGKSAYVANVLGDTGLPFDDGRVSQYDIDPQSGRLSPKAPATIATLPGPNSVAVTPDGRSAYVADTFGDLIQQYDIDPQSGALSPKSPATVAARSEPLVVAVTPDGRSAYVTAFDEDIISQYDIDPVSGALSPKTPATVAGTRAGAIGGAVVTPDGKSAYVPNPFADTVSQYDIDALSGRLSPKSPPTVGPVRAIAVAVAPDGKSAYVTNHFADPGAVSQYDIDPVSGRLSPKTPATVIAGIAPAGIAVLPPRLPTSKDQCKNGGWRNFPGFKNQGDCVSFVVHH